MRESESRSREGGRRMRLDTAFLSPWTKCMSKSSKAALNCFLSLNRWGVFETGGFCGSVWRCAHHFPVGPQQPQKSFAGGLIGRHFCILFSLYVIDPIFLMAKFQVLLKKKQK